MLRFRDSDGKQNRGDFNLCNISLFWHPLGKNEHIRIFQKETLGGKQESLRKKKELHVFKNVSKKQKKFFWVIEEEETG